MNKKTILALFTVCVLSCSRSTDTAPEIPTARDLNFNVDNVTENADFSKRYVHASVVFDNKLWVIGGVDENGYTLNDVWSSTDGVTWIEATKNIENSDIFSARAAHRAVVFNNKLWVIGGNEEIDDNFKNDVWSSTDGITWTEVTKNVDNSDLFSPRQGFTAIVFNDKIWVIGGADDNGNRLNDIWYSNDGSSWIEVTDNVPFSPRDFHGLVVFNDKLWVIGGEDYTGYQKNDVWYSSDGITWAQATKEANFSTRWLNTTVAYNNKLWVIAGYEKNDMWYSEDGSNWELVNIETPFPNRAGHTSVIHDGKIWIIGGRTNNAELMNDVWVFD